MVSVKTAFNTLLLFLIFSVNNSFAAARSGLSLDIGTDSDDGSNYYLSGQYAFNSDVLLKLAGGESTSKDETNQEYVSRIQTAGLKAFLSKHASLGLDISNNNQINTIDIDSIKVTVEANTLDWGFYLSPEFRDIAVKTLTNRLLNINSNGLSTGIAYYGWNPFYISITRTDNSYSQRVTAVSNRINFFTRILGTATTNQIFSLEESRTALEIGYYFDHVSVALNQSKGTSAIDKSILTVNKMYLSYKINDNWLLGLSVGNSSLNIGGNTDFVSTNISYRW